MSVLRKPVEPRAPERRSAIIMSFPKALSARIRAVADDRRDHAESMIAALIDYVLTQNLADGMLDALRDTPRPGHGKVVAGGVTLTHNQAAALVAIGQNTQGNGGCPLSVDGIAIVIGRSRGGVQFILQSLKKRGFVRRAPQPKPGVVSPWSLTAAGRAAWHDLAKGDA